jgi:predicted protein tyrosine phosphatase
MYALSVPRILQGKEVGRRHNTNLHSGTATIVRYIDYMIGRYQATTYLVIHCYTETRRKKSIPIFLVITMTMDPALKS